MWTFIKIILAVVVGFFIIKKLLHKLQGDEWKNLPKKAEQDALFLVQQYKNKENKQKEKEKKENQPSATNDKSPSPPQNKEA